MTALEQVNYYESLKTKLWKAVFKGKANKKTHSDLQWIYIQLSKLNEILNPRRGYNKRKR